MPEPFPGHPPFLAAAAEALGLPPGAADDARRQPAVAQVAGLVAQVVDAKDVHPDTLQKLGELRDGLKVAARAAEMMVDLVARRGAEASATARPAKARKAAKGVV